MRDIQVNDEVIDSLGNVAKVTNCYDHDKLKFYKITFSDGSTVECCKDHLWKVLKGKRDCTDIDLTDNENFKTFDTKTIISKLKKCKNNKNVYYIPDIPKISKINNTKIDKDVLRKYLILGICLEYANKRNLDICDIDFNKLPEVLNFINSDELIDNLVRVEAETVDYEQDTIYFTVALSDLLGLPDDPDDDHYLEQLEQKEDKLHILKESINNVNSIYSQEILPILNSLQSLDLNSLINLDESLRSCICLGMMIYNTCIYTNSEIIKDSYNPDTETLNNIESYLLFCCIFNLFVNEYSSLSSIFAYLELEAEEGRYGLDFLNDNKIVDILCKISDADSPIFYSFEFSHCDPRFSIFATVVNYFYFGDRLFRGTITPSELFKYLLNQSSDTFKFLFNSLGYVSYLNKNKEPQIRNVRSSHRYIKSIEYIGNKPGKCISVDSPQETYMVESFIVTHNTKEIIDLARYYRKSGQIKRCLVICGVNGNKYNFRFKKK